MRDPIGVVSLQSLGCVGLCWHNEGSLPLSQSYLLLLLIVGDLEGCHLSFARLTFGWLLLLVDFDLLEVLYYDVL